MRLEFIESNLIRKEFLETSKTIICSSKLKQILTVIEEIRTRKEKCIVFSQFLGTLTLLERLCHQSGISFERIDGSFKMKERKAKIERFSAEELNISVLLISLKTGAVGLDLVCANNVLLVDPSPNPAIMAQAFNRIRRIGQTAKEVHFYEFYTNQTIEERLYDINQEKKKLISSVLSIEDRKRKTLEETVYLMQDFTK